MILRTYTHSHVPTTCSYHMIADTAQPRMRSNVPRPFPPFLGVGSGDETTYSGALRTGKGSNGYNYRSISDSGISTCEHHLLKVKVSTESTSLALSKNRSHAH